MIVNPDITKDNEKQTDRKHAISLCLYNSDRLNVEKHVDPLVKKIDGIIDSEYDLIIFYEDGFPYLDRIPDHPSVRKFRVRNKIDGYNKHMMRYFASIPEIAHQYDWIWYVGSDTPDVPGVHRGFVKVASMMNMDAVTFVSTDDFIPECMGMMAANKKTNALLQRMLIEIDPGEMHPNIAGRLCDNFRCDEVHLSRWMRRQKIRSVIVVGGSPREQTMRYLKSRIQWGPGSVIISLNNFTGIRPEYQYPA